MTAVDREFGTASNEAIDFSLNEARIALDDLATGVGILDAEGLMVASAGAAYDEFATSATATLSLL